MGFSRSGRPEVLEVVGVVPDVVTNVNVLQPLAIYQPAAQAGPSTSRTLVVKAAADVETARREIVATIRQMDPQLTHPLFLTLQERLWNQMGPRRNHVIGILQHAIDAGIRQHHAGDAAEREQEDEADRPQHRRLELDRAAPHGGDPREDFHAGRHRDHHGGGDEIGLRRARHAHRVHVVRPHHEADAADRDHRIGHAEIAEHRLLGEGRDDLADHAEAGQDQDVDFGMAEEPEQMLEQHRIAAAVGGEERGAEIAVGEQHGDGAGQHRQRQQQQEHGHQDRPHEQRHLVQGHARRAHVEDGGDEIDRAQDRRGAGEMQRQDREIHRRSRMARGRQRRIDGPARADAIGARLALDEGGNQQQREGGRQQPERNVVHARERHIRRADHQRHKPVPKTADHRRHHHEEDHDQAVRRDEHIIGVGFVEDLHAGIHQLDADHDRHRSTNDAGDDREHQVHRADVLVVGRIDEAPPAGRMVVRVIVMRVVVSVVSRSCGRCHFQILILQSLGTLRSPSPLVLVPRGLLTAPPRRRKRASSTDWPRTSSSRLRPSLRIRHRSPPAPRSA